LWYLIILSKNVVAALYPGPEKGNLSILVEYRMVKSAAIESAVAKGAYQEWSFPPRAEAYSSKKK